MKPVAHMAAQSVVVKIVIRLLHPTPDNRQSQTQRLDGIPDRHGLNINLVIAMFSAKGSSILTAATCTIMAIRLSYGTLGGAMGSDQTHNVNHPRQRPDGISAPRITHQNDLVARFVARGEHTICALNLAIDTLTSHHTPGARPVTPLNASLVIDGQVCGLACLGQQLKGQPGIRLVAGLKR